MIFLGRGLKIIGQVGQLKAPSQKNCPRCGRLVLSLDAGQQNLGEVVALDPNTHALLPTCTYGAKVRY